MRINVLIPLLMYWDKLSPHRRLTSKNLFEILLIKLQEIKIACESWQHFLIYRKPLQLLDKLTSRSSRIDSRSLQIITVTI